MRYGFTYEITHGHAADLVNHCYYQLFVESQLHETMFPFELLMIDNVYWLANDSSSSNGEIMYIIDCISTSLPHINYGTS
jgi:hypothetical protein